MGGWLSNGGADPGYAPSDSRGSPSLAQASTPRVRWCWGVLVRPPPFTEHGVFGDNKLLWQKLPVSWIIPRCDCGAAFSCRSTLLLRRKDPAVLICKGLPMHRSHAAASTNTQLHRRACLVALVALLLSQTGCGMMAHMLYWARGNPVAEKFSGLKGKKVAVVCFDGNIAGQGAEADTIAKKVGQLLARNVEKIDVVPHQKVAEWIDEQADNVNDFKEVGRGVKADMVVAIEVDQFSTHEGQQMLRGKSRFSVKVYDLKNGGKMVYSDMTPQVLYPESGPRPIDNEELFKRQFIEIIAKKIAKDFYRYDRLDDFGNDVSYGE